MYAHEIFTYLKSRETHYVIKDYMPNQKGITSWMRALLVDWLVEVQENFELNHETLYLAVKLVDMYLGKVQVNKATLQLVGAAAMLIAAKYDERIPPIIDDFIHVCDGAYTRRDMTRMEVQILKTMDFNLGIPLSYRFLRRYARCAKIQMPLLTLARFILEYSLMEYPTITLSDSKMAAASLYLALKMKKSGSWTNTLHYFSGYKVEDFKEVAILLNSILHKPPKDLLSTVRSKYSHKIFFEVAKTPLVDDCEL
uniref:Uncharacterized protein n=1 Tax=Clastoptera arizonana TaxID=38151 RepID=A0A1B6DIX4_9HEMI